MILAERAARDVERTARLTAEAAVAKARFGLHRARPSSWSGCASSWRRRGAEAFGQSSEAGARIGQFELALEDIEEETIAAMRAAEEMAAPATPVDTFTRPQAGTTPAASAPAACPTGLSQPVRMAHAAPGRLHKLGEGHHRVARTCPGELVQVSPARAREVLLPIL